MKLIFLGSGSAFTVGRGNYHSNMLLEDSDEKRLLIDCGSDARLSLFELVGLDHRHIDTVYISHLHADHVGGLEWLAFSTKFDKEEQKKINLFLAEALVQPLWNNVLAGGLSSLNDNAATLEAYFNVQPVASHNSFEWQRIKFILVKTIHTYNDSKLSPSYGLFFSINNISCLITTDTQLTPILFDYYQKADIIFHDCETLSIPSGVHSHYKDLITLDTAIKSKIWLYHYNPGALPDALRDGFRGFVKCGQCFDFNDQNSFAQPKE